MDLDRFVSLGDNCEFGFVLRRFGHEEGSLLRWSLTHIPAVAHAIRTDFAGLYHFQNLEPALQRMLRDGGTDLKFHSDLIVGGACVPEAERPAIYEREKQKIDHLTARMRAQLASPATVFVYKDFREPPAETVADLAAAIAERGPAALLYVRAAGEAATGRVRAMGGNLYEAEIDRFAPYDAVDRASYPMWRRILADACAAIPATRVEA